MNKHTGYWDQGIDAVPRMTGLADEVLNCADLINVCDELGLTLPVPNLLDVGCGTGRCSILADTYLGVDISPSAIGYCQRRGVNAVLIDGPADLWRMPVDLFTWVFACSVFTHIDRQEQREYLRQFVRLAPKLFVDILPDDPGQSCLRWGTDEAGFRQDMAEAGYVLSDRTVDRVDSNHADGGVRHRYYTAERRP